MPLKEVCFASLTALLIGLLAACNTQTPASPAQTPDEFQAGDVPEYKPGVAGEVHTVTLPDPDGNPVALSYEVIDGLAIFDGDMILGTAEEFAQFADADEIVLNPQSAAFHERVCWKFIFNLKCKAFRWPDGIVPYTFRNDWGDQSTNLMMRQRIREAMDEVEAVTAVRFVPRNGHDDYVRFQDSSGCSAHVGRQGGRQRLNLHANCGKWIVVHELLHALGFMHEHTRHDRDEYVTVHEENIRNVPAGFREFQPELRNFRQTKKAFDLGPYDYDSIMHYPKWAFAEDADACRAGDLSVCMIIAKNGVPPGDIGQTSFLSDGDIAGINFLYIGPAPELTLISPAGKPL